MSYDQYIVEPATAPAASYCAVFYSTMPVEEPVPPYSPIHRPSPSCPSSYARSATLSRIICRCDGSKPPPLSAVVSYECGAYITSGYAGFGRLVAITPLRLALGSRTATQSGAASRTAGTT